MNELKLIEQVQITDVAEAKDYIDMDYFSDYGECPMGNALLCPLADLDSDSITDAYAACVVKAARLTLGYKLNDQEIGILIGGQPYNLNVNDDAGALEALYDVTCDTLDDREYAWAHYGGWGGLNSYWLVIRKGMHYETI